MEYREFVSTCKQKLENTLGEGFSVKETEVRKNNSQTYVGLTISTAESNVAPNIYFEEFYEAYKEGAGIDNATNSCEAKVLIAIGIPCLVVVVQLDAVRAITHQFKTEVQLHSM